MQPILKIDLTSGKIETFTIPVEFERDYLGGASLAARLLYDSFDPQRDPLDPESPLLILNGPLTGTAGPAVRQDSGNALRPRAMGESRKPYPAGRHAPGKNGRHLLGT